MNLFLGYTGTTTNEPFAEGTVSGGVVLSATGLPSQTVQPVLTDSGTKDANGLTVYNMVIAPVDMGVVASFENQSFNFLR